MVLRAFSQHHYNHRKSIAMKTSTESLYSRATMPSPPPSPPNRPSPWPHKPSINTEKLRMQQDKLRHALECLLSRVYQHVLEVELLESTWPHRFPERIMLCDTMLDAVTYDIGNAIDIHRLKSRTEILVSAIFDWSRSLCNDSSKRHQADVVTFHNSFVEELKCILLPIFKSKCQPLHGDIADSWLARVELYGCNVVTRPSPPRARPRRANSPSSM